MSLKLIKTILKKEKMNMASTYNPYSDIKSIYDLKGQWDEANKAGDATKKNQIAATAQAYYDNLKNNDYGGVAQALSASNYQQSKTILDKYSPTPAQTTTSIAKQIANTHNPYAETEKVRSEIENVYNAKVGWDNATTDEERKKYNEIANAARSKLESYGYGDIANQISATGADSQAAKKVLERYASAPAQTTDASDTELITKHNNEVGNKINQLWGIQTNDRATMADKYNKLEETAYSNPFTTDEAKAILGKYSLAGMQARDNATASGGASNGGNIDSYAAANAMRQQSALINQGQMTVLEAHNNKINNVKGILSDLGVYQQNQDKGMQNTIGLQQGESQRLFENNESREQRLFENSETSKNNEMDNWVKEASITGKTPLGLSNKNNPYLNSDGTIKEQYKDIDFSAVMAKAKASGDTATYEAAAVARFYKIMGNYGLYGKYDDGNYKAPVQQQTEEGRQADMDYKYKDNVLKEEGRQFDVGAQIERETLAENGRQFDVGTKESGRQFDVSAQLQREGMSNSQSGSSGSSSSGSSKTTSSSSKTTSSSNSKDTKSKLTISQATTALKNGEISDEILKVYNDYYGKSYTIQNPPAIYNKKLGDQNAQNEPAKDVTSYNISKLGLGPISLEKVRDLANAGIVIVKNDGTVQWAPGYNENNYQKALQQKKFGLGK